MGASFDIKIERTRLVSVSVGIGLEHSHERVIDINVKLVLVSRVRHLLVVIASHVQFQVVVAVGTARDDVSDIGTSFPGINGVAHGNKSELPLVRIGLASALCDGKSPFRRGHDVHVLHIYDAVIIDVRGLQLMVIHRPVNVHKEYSVRKKLDVMVIDYAVAVDVRCGKDLDRLLHEVCGVLVQDDAQFFHPVHAVFQRADDVVHHADVQGVHLSVAVHVHRMLGQDGQLIQVIPVDYAVVIDVRPPYGLGQVRLHLLEESQDIVQFVHVFHRNKSVGVDVAPLEDLHQLAQPVHVVGRYPAILVQIGYLFLVIGDPV